MSPSSSDLIRPALPTIVLALLCFFFALGAVLGQSLAGIELFDYIVAIIGFGGIALFVIGFVKSAALYYHEISNKN